MPDIVANLDFLDRRDVYDSEKPYLWTPGLGQGVEPTDPRRSNMRFKSHDNITIRDMRQDNETAGGLDTRGFQYHHQHFSTPRLESATDIAQHKDEIQRFLKDKLDAVDVFTYNVLLRRNAPLGVDFFELDDPLVHAKPARGAHNDVTYGKCHFKR